MTVKACAESATLFERAEYREHLRIVRDKFPSETEVLNSKLCSFKNVCSGNSFVSLNVFVGGRDGFISFADEYKKLH